MISFLFLSLQFVIQAVILDHEKSYTLILLQRTATQTLESFFSRSVPRGPKNSDKSVNHA